MIISHWRNLSAPARSRTKLIAALSAAVATAVAAVTFIPDDQPWGYVAEPALNTQSLKDGNAVAYVPWFETGTMRGDILALPLSATGAVGFVPQWRASETVDAQNFNTGRRIVTTNGANGGIPFRYDSLEPDQQLALNSSAATAAAILDFVRGDRSGEGTSFRERSSVMGTVVHSSPEYVGKPNRAYTFEGYEDYVATQATRTGRVYVAANDGMVHAFDAAIGTEAYAYVPSMIIDKLPRISSTSATHQYLVDGHLTAEDAQIDGAWGTYLVGGLGAGGKGFFALDVTDPNAASETAAASKVLWEFHPGSAGAANLGYSYGRPSVVRLDDSGTWHVVVSNGYQSDLGVASLYILDLKTGAVEREIVVPDMDANGLSSPTVVDTNVDGFADTAYAGDRNGNLWKFDLNSGTVAYGGPLFRTAANQPITTAPEVGSHPRGGLMVYVGTGELMRPEDGDDTSVQSIYGIWDNGSTVTSGQLIRNTLKKVIHDRGVAVRTVSNVKPDWDTHRGWVVDAVVTGASAAELGERVLQEPALRNGRLSATLINPTVSTGENWLVMLDALSGGPPSSPIIDVTGDNILNVADNADGDGDGAVTDAALDRVVGEYQDFGLASRPLIVRKDAQNDSLLINHLAAIPPTGLPPIPPLDVPPDGVIIDPSDLGIAGGHFDLDTSSRWYSYGGGDTDGHVHEWDDKWNRTTINLFDLPDDGKLFDVDEIVSPNVPFLLTVGNTALSSGAVLEVNGVTISAVEYHDLQTRYFKNLLRVGEEFPVYMLNKPTGAAAAAGYRQLTSLKVSFSVYAIVTGGLIPTETGCVRGNDIGANGEYRNGAFIVQALDATGIDPKNPRFIYNSTDNVYEDWNGIMAIHGEHGHAVNNSIEYEASVFWHWDGDCYNTSNWDTQYQTCVTNGGCWSAELAADADGKDSTKDSDKDSDKDTTTTTDPVEPPPDGSGTDGTSTGGSAGTPAEESDPDHNVSETTILGGDPEIGRLFWREIVPE